MSDTLQPQLKVSFRKSIAMGPGKAALLDSIQKNGSISAAARDLGMSYRRAWILVDTMNQCFSSVLVETLTGGTRGGGAQVTEFGKEVLLRYRAMELKATSSVSAEMAEFSQYML
jgi:molybdate transport system regulatory protein